MFEVIADLLFPKFCFGCGGEGVWLCDSCIQSLLETDLTPCCPECQRATINFSYCNEHKVPGGLEGVVVCGEFKGLLREVIHGLKYDGLQELGIFLSDILAEKINALLLLEDPIIISVPLHAVRLKERGFNQSDVIAQKLIGVIRNDLVFRARNTTSQASLDKIDRANNIKDSFRLSPKAPSIIGERSVLLVDDVLTTGATLKELASVVAEARPMRIWATTVARS